MSCSFNFVHDATGALAEADLVIPPWVPFSVARAATDLHCRARADGDLEAMALVERLATDPRMEAVWLELGKRHRGGRDRGNYFHAVRLGPGYDRETAQGLGCVLIFRGATVAVAYGIRSWPAGDLDERDLIAMRANPILRGLLTRRRGDHQSRGFVLVLARQFERLFGHAMPGLIARIASVALDKELTQPRVREIIRNRMRS